MTRFEAVQASVQLAQDELFRTAPFNPWGELTTKHEHLCTVPSLLPAQPVGNRVIIACNVENVYHSPPLHISFAVHQQKSGLTVEMQTQRISCA